MQKQDSSWKQVVGVSMPRQQDTGVGHEGAAKGGGEGGFRGAGQHTATPTA